MGQKNLSPRFWCSVYVCGSDTLVAVADEDIVGKKLEEKELTLDVKKSFYGQALRTESELGTLLTRSTIVNAVGKNIVSLLIKNNFVDRDCVITIQGVPHAQVVRM